MQTTRRAFLGTAAASAIALPTPAQKRALAQARETVGVGPLSYTPSNAAPGPVGG